MDGEQHDGDEELREAQAMLAVIEAEAPDEVAERLRIRLRALGPNVGDEVMQFRELRKACQESPPLALALDAAGFGRIDEMDAARITPEAGRVVQVFNRLVEAFWGPASKAPIRRIVYTRDDLDPV